MEQWFSVCLRARDKANRMMPIEDQLRMVTAAVACLVFVEEVHDEVNCSMPLSYSLLVHLPPML